jgi:hypothetical protein
VAEDILVDPQNDGSFVYKLTNDGFTLYSRGRNDIDEAGRYKGGGDDWPIWPTRHMKSKTQEEDTNDR